MGLSAEWFAIRAPDAESAEAARSVLARLGDRFASPVTHAGWLWTYSWDVFSAAEDEMSGISSEVRQPVIGGFVVDSDFGYLTATDPTGSVAFEFPVNEPYEADGPVCARLAAVWTDSGRRSDAARALSAWSSEFAPKSVSAEAVLLGMPGHGVTEPPEGDFFGDPDEVWSIDDDGYRWLFAEDGLRFLFDQIGFDLDGATWSAPENEQS